MARPRFGTEEDDVTRKCGARQSREGSEVRRRRVERTSKFVVLQQGLMVWASASTSQLMSVSFLRTGDGNKQCCSRGFHGWTTLKRLVLMMCVVTRTNFWLRTVRVEQTEPFAACLHANVWNCLRFILGSFLAPASAQVLSSLALSADGLAFMSAHHVRNAVHWASWEDCIRKRSSVRNKKPPHASTQ